MVGDYIESIIQELLVSRVVSSFRILKRIEGEEDGYVRIKCTLSKGDSLEFAEFFRLRKNKALIEMYSYHWQSYDGALFKRWDNVPHHKELKSFPHHLHLPDGKVTESSLMSLKKVLAVIEKEIPEATEDE